VTILLYQVVLVSILILLDVLLQHHGTWWWNFCQSKVSILILLDVLLQQPAVAKMLYEDNGFNPYFTGCSTSTINN